VPDTTQTGQGSLPGRHSYFQIFMVYEVALVVTSLLFLPLGEYAYPAPKAAPPVSI
jgi:hypothetical protein